MKEREKKKKSNASFPSTTKLLRSRINNLLRIHRFHVPNHIGIFLNAAIATEKPHPTHADDRLADPLVVVLVRLVDQRVGLDVAVKIVAD